MHTWMSACVCTRACVYWCLCAHLRVFRTLPMGVLSAYLCVCICACVCVCVYIYTHIYTRTYLHTHFYVGTCMHSLTQQTLVAHISRHLEYKHVYVLSQKCEQGTLET